MTQWYCFGRGYPNAPGKTRGGCTGRCPGLVMKFNDPPAYMAGLGDGRFIFNGFGPFHYWERLDIAGAGGESSLRKELSNLGAGGWHWNWNLVYVDFVGGMFGNFRGIIPTEYDCHGSILLFHELLSGSWPEVPPPLTLFPCPYEELPDDFCIARL